VVTIVRAVTMLKLLVAIIAIATFASALFVPKPVIVSRSRHRVQRFDDQTLSAPPRHDTCKVLISGVVGSDAKEIYLKSGHYVVNFAVRLLQFPLRLCADSGLQFTVQQLALVGHFQAVHPQEHTKAAETMWLSAEMWGDLARSQYSNIKKGHMLHGVGYLILNKWVDKLTGEERKLYKLRITKAMTHDEFNDVSVLLDVCTGDRASVTASGRGDSSFSSEHPPEGDQSVSQTSGGGLLDTPTARPHGVHVAPGVPVVLSEPRYGVVTQRSHPQKATPNMRDGPAIWNLLENAKEGDYLPWWE
jgi:single-stranded DNA-binding protein